MATAATAASTTAHDTLAQKTKDGSTISGGGLVAKALKAEGVDTVFTLCGGHIIDIYDGCIDEGIRIIDVRHEQTAAHAADGYARQTGKLGCVVTTAGPGCTPGPATAGAQMPDSTLSGKAASKADSIFHGDPPLDDEASDPISLAESLQIDWAGYKDGTAITPDHVVTDVKKWPDTSNWEVTFVDNEEGLSHSVDLKKKEGGNGVLIINGDVRLSGDFRWNGIILVGGRVELTGMPQIDGNLIAGLNVLTGSSVPPMQLGHGNPDVLYNSCHVDRAASLLPPLPPIVAEEPSTWVESF